MAARWSRKEKSMLKHLYTRGAKVSAICSALPSRSWAAISRQATRMGLAHGSLIEAAFPNHTLDNPFDFGGVPGVLFINAANVGSVAQGDMDDISPFVSSLKIAEASGYGVVLSGGTIASDPILRNWGINTPRRVGSLATNLTSADLVEYPEMVVRPPVWQDRVKPRNPADLLANHEMVFARRDVRFLSIMERLRTMVHSDEDSPVFSGQIAIVLGPGEVEVAFRMVTDLVRSNSHSERSSVQADRAYIRKMLKGVDDEDLTVQLEQLIQDLTAYLADVRMSNLNFEYVQDLVLEYLAWLVQQFECTIPNSRVIGLGKAVILVGGRRIKITRKQSASVAQETNADTVGAVRASAQSQLALGLPTADAIVIAGKNPICDQVAVSRIIPSAVRSKGNSKVTVPITSLPPTVLRGVLKDSPVGQFRPVTPLEKLYGHEDFRPGCLAVETVGGMLRFAFYDGEFLENPSVFGAKPKTTVGEALASSSNIYIGLTGDQHWGLRSVLIPTPSGNVIPLARALEEFLLDYAPIHLKVFGGDGLQGTIHEAATHEVPADIPTAVEFARQLEEFGDDSVALREYATRMAYGRGEDTMERQFQLWQSAICVPLITAVLARARQTNIRFEGEGDLVTLIRGNHPRNSLRGDCIFVHRMAEFLMAEVALEDPGLARFAKRHISAPLHGDLGFMRGAVCVGRQKVCCVLAQHELGVSSRGNPAKAMRKQSAYLGSHTPYADLPQVVFSAHTHVGCASLGRRILVQSPSSGQGETDFGLDKGFPVAVNGAYVLGFPVKGRAWGPVSLVPVYVGDVELVVWSKLEVDVEKLFPNPV